MEETRNCTETEMKYAVLGKNCAESCHDEKCGVDADNCDSKAPGFATALQPENECSVSKEPIPKTTCLDIVKNWNKRSKNMLTCVPTGFPALDEALGGGIRGLCLLGGMTGVGKTAFALQIASQIRNTDVFYYTIEMAPEQLAARMLSRIAFQNGKEEYTESRLMSLAEIPDWLVDLAEAESERSDKELNFSEISETFISVSEILSDVKARKEKSPEKSIFIVIDYLQILKSENPADSKRIDIDTIMQLLLAFCHKFNTSALVLSSINRAGYDQPIGLNSFKESGGIEYSADSVIGLQHEGAGENKKRNNNGNAKNEYPRKVEAVILKSRFSSPGGASKFNYYSGNHYFKETSSVNIENNKDANKTMTDDKFYLQKDKYHEIE